MKDKTKKEEGLTLKQLRKVYREVHKTIECPRCKKEMQPTFIYACEEHGITMDLSSLFQQLIKRLEEEKYEEEYKLKDEVWNEAISKAIEIIKEMK